MRSLARFLYPSPGSARSGSLRRWPNAGMRSSSARARTAWPLRSRSPRPAARCSCSRPPTTIGGGTRSAELTLPGFRHDVCSAIHPLALASPFLRRLPLREHGLEFAQPEIPLAHPLDDGTAVVLHRSLDETADGPRRRRRRLPRAAGAADRATASRSLDDLLGPLRVPRNPLAVRALRALRAALGERASPARASRARARERCSPATPRTPCARSRARRLPASRCMLMMARPRRRLAGRGGRIAGDRAMRWPRCCARWAARSAPASEVRSLARVARRARRAVRPHAAAGRSRSPATSCRPATAARSVASAHGPGRLQARLRARGAGSVDGARVPPRGDAPPRRDARGDRARRGRGRERPPPEPPVRARRPAEPVRPEPRPGRQRTRCGPTATCRTARRSTPAPPSRRRSSASRRAFATSSWRAAPWARPSCEAHNANYIGGDINGGAADLRQLFARPVARPRPLHDAQPALLHLLVVDPARRRRARRCAAGTRRRRRCGALR